MINKTIYLLLSYNLSEEDIYNYIAYTENENEMELIKDGLCIGKYTFRWAKLIKRTEFNEMLILELNNKQLLYRSISTDFDGWLTLEQFKYHFPYTKIPE